MIKMIIFFTFFSFVLTTYGIADIYKVDDYGAKGDGVTDDRYAIQKALNDLKANGGELQFTSGKEYIINAGLDVVDFSNSRNYKITTSGADKAIVKIADGAPANWGYWVFRVDNSKNVEMNNLILDGNRDTREPEERSGIDCLFVLDNCNGLRLKNLTLINSPCDNIYIAVRDHNDPTTFLTDFEMYNCVLENAFRNNMSVIRGKNFKIIGCEFNNANGTSPEAGIDFEPNRGGDSMGYQNILVEGCAFRNNDQYGIQLSDIETESGYSTLKNNIFDNNALFIDGEYNVVKNNIFINLDHMPTFSNDQDPRDGIVYFHTGYTSNYNKVYNNYFYNNPTPSDMHLIGFMGSSGMGNEVYYNYAYNNNVAGFVNRTDGQIIYGNEELNRIEMGFWNLDKEYVSDSSVIDLSDFKQTGKIYGGPVITGGKFNEALDFSPDNKHIEIPINREHLNIEMNLTISAWVNWNGPNSESEQVIVGRSGDWRFGINNEGEVGFYAPHSNDSSYIAGWTRADSAVPNGEWTFVAMTYDGRETKIYIDGEVKGSEQGYGRLDTNSVKIYIASLIDDEKSFNGSIDDVRIYNYPLSAEEITELYTAVNMNNKSVPEGSGTGIDPYRIKTIQNLSWLAQTPEAWDAYYIQVADIDLSVSATWDDADDDSDGDRYNDANDRLPYGNNEGWYPLGDLNRAVKFSGTYDGNGYTIKGITIGNRSESGNGFFGEINKGVVKNLGLTDINIQGSNIVGGLVANCNGDSLINSFTTGSVICKDDGTIGSYFGGLIGKAVNVTISECYSSVDIKGSGVNSEKIGGLVGSVSVSTVIKTSFSTGNIDSAGASSGGFAGAVESDVSVSKSYCLGNIQSNGSGVAGFIGIISGSSTVNECYSTGLVDIASSNQGFIGMIGDGSPSLTSNFFDKESSNQTNSIGAAGKTTEEMINAATFTAVGWNFTSVWDSKNNYPNLRCNSNPDLEKGINYKPITPPKGMGTKDDPYQISGLSDLAWLCQVDSVWNCYYVQTADIDAAQTATWDDSDDDYDGDKYNDPDDLNEEGANDGFSPVGSNSIKFMGYYDGGGYKISGLNINRPDSKYIGFFGCIAKDSESNSEIKNLGLSELNLSGKGRVGGFVGENSGVIIRSCYVEGDVKSNSTDGYIGGFVGSNNFRETLITKCYSDVHVVSNGSGKYVGGFVGRNRSEAVINQCYCKGRVESGGNKIGGFIGQNTFSTVSNCFSLASVLSNGSGSDVGGFCGAVYEAKVEYCYSVGSNAAYKNKGFLGAKGGMENTFASNYLDTLASGCNQSFVPEAAAEKTTVEMKKQTTYRGWDFTNIWEIKGNNYPQIKGVVLSLKDDNRINIIKDYVLIQNYPNPFNPVTKIGFTIPVAGKTTLCVYNILGRKIATLVDRNLTAGNYQFIFKANKLSSGIYFYKLQTNTYSSMKKMILLK